MKGPEPGKRQHVGARAAACGILSRNHEKGEAMQSVGAASVVEGRKQSGNASGKNAGPIDETWPARWEMVRLMCYLFLLVCAMGPCLSGQVTFPSCTRQIWTA